jgi:hypothetical protein
VSATSQPPEATVTPAPALANEVEPNNDPSSPTVIELPVLMQGKLLDKSDRDYFKFAVPIPQRDIVNIKIQNRSPTLGVDLQVLDQFTSSIALKDGYSSARSGLGTDLETSFATGPNSTYYISINP